MPRPESTPEEIVKELVARLDDLVVAAREAGRREAFAEVRRFVSDDAPTARSPVRAAAAEFAASSPPAASRGPKLTKSGRPRRNPWADMTPEERRERVRRMLAGRGLTPADEGGAAPDVADAPL